MITPKGRYLGRKPDKQDARDRRFAVTHSAALSTPVPVTVDLGGGTAFDQGNIGSCGPNSMSRLMLHLYPERNHDGFSRLHIYAGVRDLEGDFSEDAGVETRDLFKFVAKSGAILETAWPYDVTKLFVHPPKKIKPTFPIISYSRLNTQMDMVSCLASGFKFVIGVNLKESFEGDELEKSGIMALPDLSERDIGGHDMCVDGYHLDFRNSDVFKKSGLSGDRYSDTALLVCNSWGPDWGIQGRFWMPLPYATDATTGGDAWTARRDIEPMTMLGTGGTKQPTPSQISAAIKTTREFADNSGYGGFISDELCQELGAAVARTVVQTS